MSTFFYLDVIMNYLYLHPDFAHPPTFNSNIIAMAEWKSRQRIPPLAYSIHYQPHHTREIRHYERADFVRALVGNHIPFRIEVEFVPDFVLDIAVVGFDHLKNDSGQQEVFDHLVLQYLVGEGMLLEDFELFIRVAHSLLNRRPDVRINLTLFHYSPPILPFHPLQHLLNPAQPVDDS
jgi:hypothetical protein